MNPNLRTAIVRSVPALGELGGWKRAYDLVSAYLPDNYEVGWIQPVEGKADMYDVQIKGTDVAGWTLDGYVIPRLASGLYFAEEV